jgi:hypothetical protein
MLNTEHFGDEIGDEVILGTIAIEYIYGLKVHAMKEEQQVSMKLGDMLSE